MNNPLDCVQCGACCISDFDAEDYVHLALEDLSRLTDEEQETLVYRENTYGMEATSLRTAEDRYGNCRCIALRGDVGREVSCSIYDRRPNPCRKFTLGSSACHYARRQAGLEFSDR